MSAKPDYWTTSELISLYKFLLDELSIIPCLNEQEQTENINILTGYMQVFTMANTPKNYRLALANLITGNIKKATIYLENGLSLLID